VRGLGLEPPSSDKDENCDMEAVILVKIGETAVWRAKERFVWRSLYAWPAT